MSAKRLVAGDIGHATHLLTRAYAIEGMVERGDKRGRELRLSDRQPRARGLPAAQVRHLRGARDAGGRARVSRASPASASARPSTRAAELLEAHLFDFDGDLYGRTIEVALHAYIREDEVSMGSGALMAPICKDELAEGAAPARARLSPNFAI